MFFLALKTLTYQVFAYLFKGIDQIATTYSQMEIENFLKKFITQMHFIFHFGISSFNLKISTQQRGENYEISCNRSRWYIT